MASSGLAMPARDRTNLLNVHKTGVLAVWYFRVPRLVPLFQTTGRANARRYAKRPEHTLANRLGMDLLSHEAMSLLLKRIAVTDHGVGSETSYP